MEERKQAQHKGIDQLPKIFFYFHSHLCLDNLTKTTIHEYHNNTSSPRTMITAIVNDRTLPVYANGYGCKRRNCDRTWTVNCPFSIGSITVLYRRSMCDTNVELLGEICADLRLYFTAKQQDTAVYTLIRYHIPS